jgi:hypothetical protein
MHLSTLSTEDCSNSSQLRVAGVGSSLVIQGVIALFGLTAVWIVWRLRETRVQIQSSKTEIRVPEMVCRLSGTCGPRPQN